MRILKRCGMVLCVLAALLVMTSSIGVRPAEAAASDGQQQARMEWWREAKFGMFIHWGVYAVPAGVWDGEEKYAEWIRHRAHIPLSVYEHIPADFNPTKYNPDRWVRLAKQAGMKYMVITSKHHDGFCIFDSELTEWDVIDSSPYDKDLLMQLRRSANKVEDFKLGYYYSIMDWHHPDYLPRRGWSDRSAEGADMDEYTEYVKNQVKELIYEYDPAILWFDGGWEDTWTEERGLEVLNMIRELNPSIIVNNRLEVDGDYTTPEQHIPGQAMDRDWETCMTMNGHWGYAKYDENWKSTKTLIRNLVDIVSKGGNYLLNVGPRADGTFPEESIQRLKEIGTWMDENGESIYGTSGSPFRRLAWGRCTMKPGKLYLHVFNWPEDNTLEVPGLKNEVTGASLLATGTKLGVTREGEEMITVRVPDKALNPIDTVIVLRIEGEPDVAPWRAEQADDGSVTLKAVDATLHGDQIQFENKAEEGNIGFWTEPDDYVTWKMEIDEPGTFDVRVSYAGEGKMGCALTVNGEKLQGEMEATGSYEKFTSADLGTREINEAGKYTVTVKRDADLSPINLSKIALTPAE